MPLSGPAFEIPNLFNILDCILFKIPQILPVDRTVGLQSHHLPSEVQPVLVRLQSDRAADISHGNANGAAIVNGMRVDKFFSHKRRVRTFVIAPSVKDEIFPGNFDRPKAQNMT